MELVLVLDEEVAQRGGHGARLRTDSLVQNKCQKQCVCEKIKET